jgi:uncharacterized protein
MNYLKQKDFYLIRIKRGEWIIKSLEKLIKKEKIKGGFFTGIGAVDKVTLAHYSVDNQKYSEKTYLKAYEASSIIGNIGYCDNELIIHCHATFSDVCMNPIAGHLVDAKVSGTAELVIRPVKQKLFKKLDKKETGLKLFKFPENL